MTVDEVYVELVIVAEDLLTLGDRAQLLFEHAASIQRRLNRLITNLKEDLDARNEEDHG